eukprot:GGOE01065446.1.p1 GENE.GGOE01065446.1~~GGOE01065446.1.p1  ORF type:complete len:558 (+),score=120.19 GGOE01065446.1:45-1676(+)
MAGDGPVTPVVDRRTADALRLLQTGAMEEAGLLLAAAAQDGCCEARLHIALILQCQGALAAAQGFLRQAAEAGYAPAQLTLAFWLQDGADPDLQEACYWFEQAAQALYGRLPELGEEEHGQLITAAHGVSIVASQLGHQAMAQAYDSMVVEALRRRKEVGPEVSEPELDPIRPVESGVVESVAMAVEGEGHGTQQHIAEETGGDSPRGTSPVQDSMMPPTSQVLPSPIASSCHSEPPSEARPPFASEPLNSDEGSACPCAPPADSGAFAATPPTEMADKSNVENETGADPIPEPCAVAEAEMCDEVLTTRSQSAGAEAVATLTARVAALEATVRHQAELLDALQKRLDNPIIRSLPLPPPPPTGLVDVARLPAGYLVTPDHCAVLKPKGAPPACVFLRVRLARQTTFAWEVTLAPHGTPLGWTLMCGVASLDHPVDLEPGQKSPTGHCTAWAVSHNRALCCSDARWKPSLLPPWQTNWLQPGGALGLEFNGSEAGLLCRRTAPRDRLPPVRFQQLPLHDDSPLVPVVWLASTYNDVLIRITAG